VGAIRIGPGYLPSQESPEAAIELLVADGYTAAEIDCEKGFWLDYDWGARVGELAREADVALSLHAPLFGWMGHRERDKKFKMALGVLDRSAGIATAAGAAPVVIHPGYFLGRTREESIADVIAQLGELGERLEGKGRLVPFGVEVMGRVAELGSVEDVVAIAADVPWVRPVLDFAHMHATSDGAFLAADAFADVLALADGVLGPDEPFHIHFSDIQYANRNETKHLPYGDGTLRAEPLREALDRFERPATVISEAPDVASTQAIRAILTA
jgi:deoxyribonuclease IV